MTPPLDQSQVYLGLALIVVLGVGCQVVANRLRIPAIVLLLPVGFAAGVATHSVDARNLLGPSFTPLVTLGIAVILFDGGLDLEFSALEGHGQRVVRRLLAWGIPVTWGGAALLAWLLFGLSGQAASMEGAILIVSGPTVVAPILALARPGRRVSAILGWESTLIDPIGAIIGVLVFEALRSGATVTVGRAASAFLGDLALGLVGGAIGTAVLWLLLGRWSIGGVLATEITLATVVGVAGLCNALREDTGLVAAITMGVAVANLPGVERPRDRPFFRTVVQLTIAVLFISISAGVTPAELGSVLVPSLGLVAGLIVVVRPVAAGLSTIRTDLTPAERAYIGLMDPRGIVAAATAASFGPTLAQAQVAGASKLLPITFVAIVGTVTVYGLAAVPAARRLGLAEPRPPGPPGATGPTSSPTGSPPGSSAGPAAPPSPAPVE